jgi:hypothetical protein
MTKDGCYKNEENDFKGKPLLDVYTEESRFFEPSRKTTNWFEKSGSSRNRG